MGWFGFGKKKEPVNKYIDEEEIKAAEQRKQRQRKNRKYHYGECVLVKNDKREKWRRGVVIAFEDSSKDEKRIFGEQGKGKPIVVLSGSNQDTTWRIYDNLKPEYREPCEEFLIENGILPKDLIDSEKDCRPRSTEFCKPVVTKPVSKPGHHASLFQQAIQTSCRRPPVYKNKTEFDLTVERLISGGVSSSEKNDFVVDWSQPESNSQQRKRRSRKI